MCQGGTQAQQTEGLWRTVSGFAGTRTGGNFMTGFNNPPPMPGQSTGTVSTPLAAQPAQARQAPAVAAPADGGALAAPSAALAPMVAGTDERRRGKATFGA